MQAGLGFGVKNFRLVWVFEKKADLDHFVNSGWEIGAQTTASAKVAGQGTSVFAGAVSVMPGVWLYQLSAGFMIARDPEAVQKLSRTLGAGLVRARAARSRA